MWYITWCEPYVNYSKIQGGGYYVNWKSKTEDEFTDNWITAKKYKTFNSAVTRLGLRITQHIDSVDKFIEHNISYDDKQAKRDFRLSKLLGDTQDLRNFLLTKGRIDKIDEKGNFMGDATDEIIDWVMSSIKGNIKRKEDLKKKQDKLLLESGFKNETVDVTTQKYADDFLDFFK